MGVQQCYRVECACGRRLKSGKRTLIFKSRDDAIRKAKERGWKEWCKYISIICWCNWLICPHCVKNSIATVEAMDTSCCISECEVVAVVKIGGDV